VIRLKGPSRAIREAAPDALVPVYEAVTTMGDTVTVLLLVSVAYWLGTRRREIAVTMGYAFAALSLVIALKAAFGYPRPPESVWYIESEGLGFPSGHATGAMVVYGGFAHAYDWWDRPRRVIPVGVLVLAIGLSRVVLGVHYLGDVLAGFALGLVAILVGTRLSDGEPRRAFAIATVCALVAVAVASGDEYAPIALGGSVGGLLATAGFDLVPPRSEGREAVAAIGIGGLAVVPTVAGLVLETLPGVVLAGSTALTVAGVVLAPMLAARLVGLPRPSTSQR